MPNLKPIQTNLKKVEDLAERRAKLVTEQNDLPTKIKTLSGQVARGDEKSVNALAIATARLNDALPEEISELEQVLNSAVGDLLESLQSLCAWAADAYAAEIQKVKKNVTDFLTPIMEDAGALQETVRLVTGNAKSVHAAYYRSLTFGGARFDEIRKQTPMDAAKVIALAHDAIQCLG